MKNDTKALQQEKRARYLKNLIKETVINVLVEQEMAAQQQVANPPAQSAVPPANPVPSPQTNITQSQEQGMDESGELTIDAMVDKLNILRGGKSLTDPEVFGRLTTYFNGLAPEQKQQLNSLLTELSNVVMGVEQTNLSQEQQKNVQGSGNAQPPTQAPTSQGQPQPQQQKSFVSAAPLTPA